MPSIYVSSGIEEGACYGFPPADAVFLVGRAPNCHIVLTDPLVSRQHCRIERAGGIFKVVDLGSHNGIYVNEEKLEKDSERPLKFGDAIRMGETELVLQEGSPDDEGELAGRRMGGYQMVKRIGSGGMGEVYKAVQVALGRPVAIKVLTPELTQDPAFIERFMTEARAAGKLNHPNVVQVHEVSESEGIYYYSMEFLAGGSVQDLIRGGKKLPVERAVAIVLGAAKALEYAEKQGVIHCDIKPDNLMLTEDGQVRLADLGIARTVASRHAKVKQEGGVLGSPHYMAPEQARGEAIDRRVDLYALGATFYRLVGGRTPFTGKNAREVMEKQVYEEPPSLRSLDSTIPQSVVRVIGMMMKKRPDKRYQSARDLIKDLTVLQEELAPAPGESGAGGFGAAAGTLTRSISFVRRKKVAGGAGLALGLVVVGVLAAAAWFGYRKYEESRAARSAAALVEVLAEADRRANRGDLEEALRLYRQAAADGPAGSPEKTRAQERAAELDRLIAGRISAAAEEEAAWQRMEADRKAGRSRAELAAQYADFAKRWPGSRRVAAARLAAQQCLEEHARDAEAQSRKLEASAPGLVAAARFSELRTGWKKLAADYAGTPAGARAIERERAAGALPETELIAARAGADKALAAGELDKVLPVLQRMAGADVPEVARRAEDLVEDYTRKVAAARAAQAKAEERRRAAAACKATADEAEKLALAAYDYTSAHLKFSEAQSGYRREGFAAEAEALGRLSDQFQKESALFNRLVDYGSEGKLASAKVRLADGLEADLVGLDSEGLTYSRGMDRTARAAWKEVPPRSAYLLLRRPKLSGDERVALAGFALRRGLFADAKSELERLLAAEPERKEALSPMLEVIEKGLSGGEKTPPKEKKD